MSIELNELAGVIFMRVRNNKIQMLMVFQSSSKFWGFPKGHKQSNELNTESNEECAIREAKEETGLIPNGFYSSFKIKNCQMFICTSWYGRIRLDTNEIEQYKWVYPSMINRMPMSNLTLAIINYITNENLLPKIQKEVFNIVQENNFLNLNDISDSFSQIKLNSDTNASAINMNATIKKIYFPFIPKSKYIVYTL